MPVVNHQSTPHYSLPGITHRTVAGTGQGLQSLEMWIQVLAPGAETPVHRHACEEAIVILSGQGEVTIDGETTPFTADSNLVVPADAVHQIRNTSDQEMRLIAALSVTPVQVRTASGDPLPVPWQVG